MGLQCQASKRPTIAEIRRHRWLQGALFNGPASDPAEAARSAGPPSKVIVARAMSMSPPPLVPSQHLHHHHQQQLAAERSPAIALVPHQKPAPFLRSGSFPG